MTSSKPDIHYVDGKYYNYNGRNPKKALTVPYAKRLLSMQKRYAGLVDTKTASGHGSFTKKKRKYDVIKEKKDKVNVKKTVSSLAELERVDLLEGIRRKEIDTKNLRTRFRSGFRVYHKDDDGNYLDSYDVISYSKAINGLVPLERFLKEIPNDAFTDNVRGGFRYVVYDKNTKKVYHEYEYGEQD